MAYTYHVFGDGYALNFTVPYTPRRIYTRELLTAILIGLFAVMTAEDGYNFIQLLELVLYLE